MSFTTRSQAFLCNFAENWSIIWFETLDVDLSPLTSMSSDLTNSSIDERITASYACLVARVDKILYEASCSLSFNLLVESRDRVVHLRLHFTSCRNFPESDMPRVVRFTCVFARFVKLGPRDAARKRSAARWGNVQGFLSTNSLFPSLVPTFPLRVARVGAACKKKKNGPYVP